MGVKKATISGGSSLRKHTTGLGLPYGIDAVQKNHTTEPFSNMPHSRYVWGRYTAGGTGL